MKELTNAELYAAAFKSIGEAYEAIQETVGRGDQYGRQAIQNLVYAMEALPGGKAASAGIRSQLLGGTVPKPGQPKARFGTKAKPYGLIPQVAQIDESDSAFEVVAPETEEGEPTRFKTKAQEYEVGEPKNLEAPAAAENDSEGAEEETAVFAPAEMKAELLGASAEELEAIAETLDMNQIRELAQFYGSKPSQGKLATLKRIQADLLAAEDQEEPE